MGSRAELFQSAVSPDDLRGFLGREAERRRIDEERSLIPECGIYDALNLVACSVYVLEKNHQELDSFLERFERNTPMAQQKAYRNQAFLMELYRYLHNYLSAAFTFREHIGAVKRKITDAAFQASVGKRFQETGADDIGRFFQDLRNFVQHRAPAPILSELCIRETSDGSPATATQKLYLEKDQLLSWDGWGSQARSFIEGHDGDIPLRDTARQHVELIRGLWSWFYREVRGLNRESFEKLDRLGQQLARLYGREET